MYFLSHLSALRVQPILESLISQTLKQQATYLITHCVTM